MKADEKRSHRLNMLYKIYVKTNYNEDAVLNRAVMMGVTLNTAKNYLDTIKARVNYGNH